MKNFLMEKSIDLYIYYKKRKREVINLKNNAASCIMSNKRYLYLIDILRAQEHLNFLNGHGDVTYFSDANFTPEQIETYEYTPWGVLLTSASKNNLLYTAREFDFEVGLQFNRMRYYNANLGRFMQKDLIFNYDKNYYSYVLNIPVNYVDPFGLYRPGGMIPWMQQPPYPGGGGEDYHEGICSDPRSDTNCWEVCSSYESCMGCCQARYDACMEKCKWWNYIWCWANCLGEQSPCETHCLEEF